MKALLTILVFTGFFFFSPKTSYSCDPPEIIHISCNGGSVLITFQATPNDSLTGFNIYRDDVLIDFLLHTGDSVYAHVFPDQPLGDHNYCITSICSSAFQGMPVEEIESEPDCATEGCYYGFDLPFYEDWSLGSFSLNDWEISSGDWIISETNGNGPPSAMFAPGNALFGYNEELSSYYINAYGMTEGHLYLTYDLSLNSLNPTGDEQFNVKVWDHFTGLYHTLKEYSNLDGSFGWISDTIDLRPYCMGRVFQLWFTVSGENSSDIICWSIDNISVYRECEAPPNQLESYLVDDTCIVLETFKQSGRDLVDVFIYVTRDGDLVDIYSSGFPMPNPYCVQESGEYCFWMSWIWESESDQCESSLIGPTCQQVLFNSVKGENSIISLFYIDEYRNLRINAQENIDQVKIYNLTGRQVYQENPVSDQFTIQLADLLPGLYIVKMLYAHKVITRKIFLL